MIRVASMENQFDNLNKHLANERTYLAWLRTGLSTMGFGILIAKFKHVFRAVNPVASQSVDDIGAILAFSGLLMIVVSARRYFLSQKQIQEGHFVPENGFVIAITVIFSILAVAIIYLILWA